MVTPQRPKMLACPHLKWSVAGFSDSSFLSKLDAYTLTINFTPLLHKQIFCFPSTPMRLNFPHNFTCFYCRQNPLQAQSSWPVTSVKPTAGSATEQIRLDLETLGLAAATVGRRQRDDSDRLRTMDITAKRKTKSAMMQGLLVAIYALFACRAAFVGVRVGPLALRQRPTRPESGCSRCIS